MKKFLEKVGEVIKKIAESVKWFFDTLSTEGKFSKIGWAIAFALLIIILIMI